ncbi:MAG: mechanosensitive ion channel, partial [Oscillospiraceae bacterium]|nr:mechanosensitive ion channel [Oscillospiraceae bacterium]
GVWAVLEAVLILILAFIAAAIVKSLTVKLLTRTKLQALLGKRDPANCEGAADFIGKLLYLIVFLLFVPGIFERLGMNGVSSPILGLLDTMWGYLPNILAAVVVLWAGFFIARLVRELLIPVFDRLKVNRLQEKAGITVEDPGKLSNTLSYIVYVLILIPVVITALRALNINAISDPAIRMLDIIFAFIPNILAALIILVIGCMVAKLAGNIVERLIGAAGLDAKLSRQLNGEDEKFALSKIAGGTVHVVLVIFFLVESFGVLHLDVLTKIGNAIIAYLPSVLAAVLILLACYIGSAMAQKALLKGGHRGFALGCRIAIYGLGGFMILSELGIAQELVNTVFILAAAALAVAFALAFGIGGREFASRMLKRAEDGVSKENHKP